MLCFQEVKYSGRVPWSRETLARQDRGRSSAPAPAPLSTVQSTRNTLFWIPNQPRYGRLSTSAWHCWWAMKCRYTVMICPFLVLVWIVLYLNSLVFHKTGNFMVTRTNVVCLKLSISLSPGFLVCYKNSILLLITVLMNHKGYTTGITRKQILRSLSLSYQKKGGRMWPRLSFFWYDTGFSVFDSADVIDYILEKSMSCQKRWYNNNKV